MTLRAYQLAEFIGILLVIASTATQIFYLEPVQRQIEWNKAAFTQQQNGQVLAREILDNRIVLLRATRAAPSEIEAAEMRRKTLIERYETADANVANLVLDKEPVEGLLQLIIMALFGLGTLLAGYGRLMELLASNHPAK